MYIGHRARFSFFSSNCPIHFNLLRSPLYDQILGSRVINKNISVQCIKCWLHFVLIIYGFMEILVSKQLPSTTSLQSHKVNVLWLYFPKLLFVSKSLLTFFSTEKNKQTLKQRYTEAFIYLQNALGMLSKLKTKRAKTTDYFNSIWSFLTPFSM